MLQQIEGLDETRLEKLLPLLAGLRAELDSVIPDAKASSFRDCASTHDRTAEAATDSQ